MFLEFSSNIRKKPQTILKNVYNISCAVLRKLFFKLTIVIKSDMLDLQIILKMIVATLILNILNFPKKKNYLKIKQKQKRTEVTYKHKN